MAGFEEQLNSILGNQEAMSQIMALARSLSGEAGEPSPAPEETGEPGSAPAAAESSPPPLDLSALMGQIDPQMLQAGMEVLRQVQSTEDRNAALLNALRPFVREERQARLDRALRIARMGRLIRAVMGRGKEGERV